MESKTQNWYVSSNVQQDNDTMLFTKRVKQENLRMDKDRVIAHVEGITIEEVEYNAKLIAAAPKLLEALITIRDYSNAFNECPPKMKDFIINALNKATQ